MAAHLREGSSALPLLKTLIFTVLVPGTIAVYVPYRVLASRQELHPPGLGPSQAFGIMVAAAGALGYCWCAWNFAVAGRGTPAPIDPPKILVARGLYRFVRNPMYVSLLLVLLGESLFFESMILLRYAAAFWAAAHLFVLFYEEPTLRRKFGKSYEDYCRAVSRWIPRPSGRKAKNRDNAI